MVRLAQHQGLLWSPFSEFESQGTTLPPSDPHSSLSEAIGSWTHSSTRTAFLPDAPIKQAISCETTGADVKFEGPQGRVVCPPNCQRGLDLAYGTSIHPLRSAVCLSGIVDGVMPVFGGEMMITKVKGVPAYAGKDVGYAASLPMTNQPGEAFTLYPVDNIDLGMSLPAERKLSCIDTFDKLDLKKPGEMKAVHCPGDCGLEGNVSGTNIFTPQSTVCRAAEHAAAVGSEGGHAIVVRGHGQPFFFGSKSGTSGASTDAPGSDASYTVSLPVPDVMSRLRNKDPIVLNTSKEAGMPGPFSTLWLAYPSRAARTHHRKREIESFL